MQLNPDTTINGENGDSLSVKWESITKGVKDLAEDINSLKQEEMLQVADMIAELRKKFRGIEKRMDKHIKAFNIYIERETSHEIRVQRNQSHGYWAFIYRDMQLVIDTLYDTQRSRCSDAPLTTAEEPLRPIEEDEIPILREIIGKDADKYLRFCREKREYKDEEGKTLILQDSKKIQLLAHITRDARKEKKVQDYIKGKGYNLKKLWAELHRVKAIKCKTSSFNDSLEEKKDKSLKEAWDSYN